VPADSFRVYGVRTDGSLALLLDTTTTEVPRAMAAVAGGVARYAVSGVRNGSESHVVLCFGGATRASADCVVMITPPPDPYVVCERPLPHVKVTDLPIS
jgi:hypothetical protein